MCSELVIPDGTDYPLMQSVPLKVIVALSLVSVSVGWVCVDKALCIQNKKAEQYLISCCFFMLKYTMQKNNNLTVPIAIQRFLILFCS